MLILLNGFLLNKYMRILDEPVSVTCSIIDTGDIVVKQITWQNQHYPVVATGRQWDEAEGRAVLAEATDGTRFELLLSRTSLSWRVKKVWQTSWA